MKQNVLTRVVLGVCCLSLLGGLASAAEAANGLTAVERQALDEVLQDEYKARATYAKVIEKFGAVRPFSNVIRAESRHAASLKGIYDQYGLTMPEDTWQGKVPEFDSLQAAAAAAVQAEIDNAALYDRIMPQVSNPAVVRVFTALRDASQKRHLPAFQRAAQSPDGQCTGNGPGQGNQGRAGKRGGQGQGCGTQAQRGGGHGMGNGRGQGPKAQCAQGQRGQRMGQGQGQGAKAQCAQGTGCGRGQGAQMHRGQRMGNGQGQGMGNGRGKGAQAHGGRGMGRGMQAQCGGQRCAAL